MQVFTVFVAIIWLSSASGAPQKRSKEKVKARPKISCAQIKKEVARMRQMLEAYKKDCGVYPSELFKLMEKPSDCPGWGPRGPYLNARSANKKVLERFMYMPSMDRSSYELKSGECR